VRNPINNISTGLQLMTMNLPSDSPHQELLGRLQQDCDRLTELMKSVLAYSRPQEYKTTAMPLAPFLQRLIERWHPRLARAKIEYTLQIDQGMPPIEADPRAMEQVFTNLIANATQAMNETGGKLTIKARLAPPPAEYHRAEISIADTGPGIPDEIRERIFEPFFTTKTGGTGLGLAITKQIITAHRGSIQVTSIPGGTVFQILLPVADQIPEEIPEVE
jgi:signal transduction histidine kinase